MKTTDTVYADDECYAMDYEFADGTVYPIRYKHFGFVIQGLPETLIGSLVAAAYQQEHARGVDHGDEEYAA